MKPYKEKKMIRSYFERIKAKALVGKTSKYKYTVYGHDGVAYQLSDGSLYMVQPEINENNEGE